MDRHPDIPPITTPVQFPLTDAGAETGQRGGVPASYPNSMPPISPYSMMSMNRQPVDSNPGSASLTRSMPPPSHVFSLESLLSTNPSPPPSSLSPPRSFFKFNAGMISPEPLPPRMAHTRSNTDKPLALDTPQTIRPNPLEIPAMNEVFTALNVDAPAVGEIREKESGTMTGSKRRAAGIEIDTSNRHDRSVSTDSSVDEDAEKQSKVPPAPTSSADGSENAPCKFTVSERKKISEDEKLSKLVTSDPKLVKRMLANRESAARSKERKARYITELEKKVANLEAEANTMSTKYANLEKEYTSVCNENTELRIRLQGMKEQARLREALNEQMSIELRRLNL